MPIDIIPTEFRAIEKIGTKDNVRRTAKNLQHGMPDATTASGDRRVVFSPKSVRAAGNIFRKKKGKKEGSGSKNCYRYYKFV